MGQSATRPEVLLTGWDAGRRGRLRPPLLQRSPPRL